MTRSLTLAVCAALATAAYAAEPLTYGVRPFYLIDNLEDGALKDELKACAQQTPKRSTFSIAHRGAALQFPEHTRDSYLAATRKTTCPTPRTSSPPRWPPNAACRSNLPNTMLTANW